MDLKYLSPFLTLFAVNVFADEADYFNLSFQELSEIQVITASQELESTAESSAIVSVITQQNLRQWGVQDVYEALSFLPGIEKYESYMGFNVLTIRGVTPGLYNTKTLFMINGHSVSDNQFGQTHLEYLPLEAIERIEVVRSSSSALYGTNAISGVVNIITKQGAELDNELMVRAGSHDHYYSSLTWHDKNVTISGSYLTDNGYRYSGTLDEGFNGNNRSDVDYDYANDLGNLFIDVHGDSWRINAAYFDQDKVKFAPNPVVWQHGNNEQEAWYLDLKKTFELWNGELNTFVRYDSYSMDIGAGNFPAPTSPETTIHNKVERYSLELQYKKQLSDTLSYIIGTTYDDNQSDPFEARMDQGGINETFSPFTSSQDYQNYAIYGQVKYQFLDNWTGVIGLRVEDNSDAGSSDLVPRLGLTYRYSNDTYLKAQYSESFRAPVFLEKYTDVPGILYGDPDLEREKIKTWEVGIDSKLNASNSIQLAAYWLDLSDEISRQSRSGGTEYYNADGREMYGIEFQWDAVINNDWSVMFNSSYVDGDVDDYDDTRFLANYSANLVLGYSFNSHWTATLSNQLIGSKEYESTYDGDGKIPSYNLTNLVLTYKTGQHEISAIAKNLFDEDYTYPEPVRRNIADVPGGPGATGYVSYSYKF